MFASTLVTLFAASLAAAAPMRHAIAPRAIEARTYAQDADLLEPYHQYNTRYIALSCQTQHGKAFFDSCCHPLLKSQKLSDRPAECTPNATASTSAAAVDATQIPPPGAVDDGDDGDDDEYDDCDDDDDEYSTTVSVAKPTATATPKPTTVAETTVKATSAAETTVKASSAAEPTTEAKPTTTHAAATTTHVKPSTTSTKAAATTAASSGSANTGGFATYFLQGGNAGACGTVHSDSDLIVAIDEARYGSSSKKSDLCGKQVKITNTNNGKSVTATIADDCPSCVNSNSIDLSEGTFKSIATLSEGMVPISWVFV